MAVGVLSVPAVFTLLPSVFSASSIISVLVLLSLSVLVWLDSAVCLLLAVCSWCGAKKANKMNTKHQERDIVLTHGLSQSFDLLNIR